jgi:5-methylcytosine-specific restriction endonuclease McrA
MPYRDPAKRREYLRVYALEHREKRNQAQREWRAANPGYANAAYRKWRDKNLEKAKAISRKWKDENPDRAKFLNRHWRQNHPEAAIGWKRRSPLTAWASASLTRHRIWGFKVLIKTNELVEIASRTPLCSYCGTALDYTPFKGSHQANSASVDRVNNEKTMQLGNVQIICMACNGRKGRRTHEQHLEHLGLEARA